MKTKQSNKPEDFDDVVKWRESISDSVIELNSAVGRHSKLIVLHSIIIVAAVCAAIVLL